MDGISVCLLVDRDPAAARVRFSRIATLPRAG